MKGRKTREYPSARDTNATRYLLFVAITLALGSYVVPKDSYTSAQVAELIVTLVGLIIGAASLFFIVFAFSIYQETRNFEELRADMENVLQRTEESNDEMQEAVLRELVNAQETERRRWKMVSITIIQHFADILRSINDREDRSSIEDELRQLEPLRYLLESVAEENVADAINSLQECVALAEGPRVSMSGEMFDILVEAIDAQNEHIEDDLDPEEWEPMRLKLRDIRDRAQAARQSAGTA